ncbi:MAG: hypothetical protein AAEJ46_13265 [Planctomycetota bacterium]
MNKNTPENHMPSNNPEGEQKKSNPFENLADLSLPQDFDSLTAQTEYSYIPCRKPGKQSFVRVSPEPGHRGNFAILEINTEFGSEREQFLVVPQLMSALSDLPGLTASKLALAVSRPENSPFLWRLRLPNNNTGRNDAWALSALDIAKQAEQKWLRVKAEMQMGCYVATVATAAWPEPQWPDLTFSQLLERSFGGNIITDLSHPAIKALRGEA